MIQIGDVVGMIFVFAAGVAMGAAIVGMCWSVSNSRVDWANTLGEREAETVRKRAETALIEAAITKIRQGSL